MSTAMTYVFTGVSGLMLGSFLNVVAWRLPRRESLVRPGSHCPGCQAPVRPYDNIPVVSWILLRGRCRSCGIRISPRYPLIEATTAILWLAVLVDKGVSKELWPALAFVAILIPAAVIDFEHRIIPNRLMLVGAVVGLVLYAVLLPDKLPEHLIAAAAAGGFLLLAVMAYPRGMGMADVKLAAVMGLYLG